VWGALLLQAARDEEVDGVLDVAAALVERGRDVGVRGGVRAELVLDVPPDGRDGLAARRGVVGRGAEEAAVARVARARLRIVVV
jgi:hypothetical protein